MPFDDIKELKKETIRVQEEPRVIAYKLLEEQGKILAIIKKNTKEVFDEIVYSEHNCEVLNRRIERTVLEEEKRVLKRYEDEKILTKFFVTSLAFINLCSMGQFNLIFSLLSVGALFFKIKAQQRAKEDYILNSYLVRLIEELKQEDIQLTKEEIKLLEEEKRALYEDDGRLFTGNAIVVCNSKVLKKRFGEK